SLQYLNANSRREELSAFRQLFRMVIQVELARMLGNYQQAQMHLESALALAYAFCDGFTLIEMLIDQGSYAYYSGQLADAQQIVQRLLEISEQLETPQAHRFAEYDLGLISSKNQSPSRLSKREMEIMEYVHLGLSNIEIAQQLVVSITTVKKHLEHIYNK